MDTTNHNYSKETTTGAVRKPPVISPELAKKIIRLKKSRDMDFKGEIRASGWLYEALIHTLIPEKVYMNLNFNRSTTPRIVRDENLEEGKFSFTFGGLEYDINTYRA